MSRAGATLAKVAPVADRPAPLFAHVHHSGAATISAGGEEEPGFDGSGSSGQLRASRPHIPYGSVWCMICNQPCDFDEGGLHNLMGRPDAQGRHRGYILIRAYCHGATADITLRFTDARQNAGKTIIAFGEPPRDRPALAVNVALAFPLLALPAPPVRLLLRDGNHSPEIS